MDVPDSSARTTSIRPVSERGGKRFPPHYRLHKTDEFSSVFAFRKAVRGKYFMLHYRPVSSGARLGLVVAKKLAKRAVQRNLVKRLTREEFRHVRDTLPSYDLILRLSQSLKGVSRAAIRAELSQLFRRLPARAHENEGGQAS